MKVTLYSINTPEQPMKCPKCHILELKLIEHGIQFDTNTNMKDMEALGMMSAPGLMVDGKLMGFGEACKWVNEQIKEEERIPESNCDSCQITANNQSEATLDIKLKLAPSFIKCWNKLREKYGEEFEKLNGFHQSNLNFTDFIDNFVDSDNVANATIDANANESIKDVRSLLAEIDKPHTKLLGYNKIFYEIEKEYGVEKAEEWLENEWNGALYLHDAPSASLYSYCYAYELKDLAERGLYFLPKTNTSPAKHLTTFAAHLREFIVWVSNRSAGACALPSFFVYSYYFWKQDCQNKYYLKDPEYYRKQFFQQFIFEVNQIHTRITQSAYTNVIVMDRNYITEIFGDRTYPDGTFVIDYVDEIIKHQKVFMEVVEKTRHEVMLTFPVITYSLLFQNGKFVDEEFARWCNKHNMAWYDANFYIGDTVTNLASCCRMLNDVSKMPKQFQSSIGGSLVEIGSVKVSTINLMRIALECSRDKEKYIEILKERVELNMLLLDRIRHIIKRNIEKGLLPNYTNGVIKMEKQTVTNGLTAMFETIERMGMTQTDELGNITYTDEGIEFAARIMDTVNELQDAHNEKHDYRASLEIIPAENANVKLCHKDSLLYNIHDYDIYSNQWTSLTARTSINERIKLSAALDKKAGGGQILHISLQSKFANEDEAWDLLNYIANSGVIYFAYNPKISICAHSHGFFGEVCPECGEKKVDEVSRLVGYLVPTASYSKERKHEYYKRQWYTTE
jgi:ribonucleoside-triphosphate reductase (formate)